MVQFSNSIETAVANRSEAMESRDHFKNGASSKSHMSRVNFRFRQMFSNFGKIVAMIAIPAMCLVGTVNAQTEPNIQQSRQTTNTPLIVVDGKEWSGIIESISPESIESISVLKDQSAVAVYGEKGRNGVVIVTTKLNQSGKVGTPLIVVDGKEWSGGIESISPESIESISILKDQSAIAVYGEKGKNGVIIITTKK